MVFGFNRNDILVLLGVSPGTIPQGLLEILDLLIMSLAIAYIFERFFFPQTALQTAITGSAANYDPLEAHKKKRKFFFNFNKQSFLIALYAIAPSVVVHELFHKFFALALGSAATFYASYGGLALGVILRLIGSPIIFFIPGFVAHASGIAAWKAALIAFSGPLANLLLWGLSSVLLAYKSKLQLKQRTATILLVSKKVNLFLFFFNMIPIPPFDGGNVLLSIIEMIRG